MGNKWAMVETIAHFIYAHAEAVENVASATLHRRENVLCTFYIYQNTSLLILYMVMKIL